MEKLHNGFTLELADGAFPLSTDSIALSGFVRLPKAARVLDLGSGCGTLGLLLCARYADCAVTGIELDASAHRTALTNGIQNGLDNRLTSICGDLRDISSLVKPGSFSCCISNPPYFSSGFKSRSVPIARSEDTCPMDALFRAAGWALKYGGDFFLVHKPERLAELFSKASQNKLEPKRLCLLRHKADGPVTLVLVQCRKGGNPGLIWEEESLFDTQGNPTDYYRKLYHMEDV